MMETFVWVTSPIFIVSIHKLGLFILLRTREIFVPMDSVKLSLEPRMATCVVASVTDLTSPPLVLPFIASPIPSIRRIVSPENKPSNSTSQSLIIFSSLTPLACSFINAKISFADVTSGCLPSKESIDIICPTNSSTTTFSTRPSTYMAATWICADIKVNFRMIISGLFPSLSLS